MRRRAGSILVVLLALLAMGSTAQPAPPDEGPRPTWTDKDGAVHTTNDRFRLEVEHRPRGIYVCVGESETINVFALQSTSLSVRAPGKIRESFTYQVKHPGVLIEGLVKDPRIGGLNWQARTSVNGVPPNAAKFTFAAKKEGKTEISFLAPYRAEIRIDNIHHWLVEFRKATLPVEVQECCPSKAYAPGAGAGVGPRQDGGVCKADAPISYHYVRMSEGSGGTSRTEYTVTIEAKFKVENGYGTDDGSTFTIAGSRTDTKLYETPCSGVVRNEVYRGGGRFLDFEGSQLGSPFVSLLTYPGTSVLDATVLADITGTYVESEDGGCVTKPIEANSFPYTLDCPFHDNSTIGQVVGTYDETSKVADLGCSDSTTHDDGDTTTTETVEVTGALNLP